MNSCDCPTYNVAAEGVIMTVGGAFIVTLIGSEVTLTGVLAPSVTFSLKLQLPAIVELEVIKE